MNLGRVFGVLLILGALSAMVIVADARRTGFRQSGFYVVKIDAGTDASRPNFDESGDAIECRFKTGSRQGSGDTPSDVTDGQADPSSVAPSVANGGLK